MGNYSTNNFEDLEAWQKSIDFAATVYTATKTFPKSEQFGITNQLRRASSSISANIAEGFGRRTVKDKLHFYTIAYGSLLETKSFIHLANKLDYDINNYSEILEEATSLQMLLNAFIKSTRKLDE
jgi:four helix bundle protein